MNKDYVGLLKFGEKKHMDMLYNEGLLYFNTFNYFINLEDNGDGRSDIYEATTEYYAGEGLNDINLIISDGYNTFPLTRENGTQSVAYNENRNVYSHLYSMTYIDVNWTLKNNLLIDERNFANGKDYVVLIYDAVKFLERLKNKLNENNWKFNTGHIEYINPNNYSGRMGCFKKLNTFSYQNEFRIAISQNNKQTPITLSIGSIKDIAFCPLSKEEFYKMKLIVTDK